MGPNGQRLDAAAAHMDPDELAAYAYVLALEDAHPAWLTGAVDVAEEDLPLDAVELASALGLDGPLAARGARTASGKVDTAMQG